MTTEPIRYPEDERRWQWERTLRALRVGVGYPACRHICTEQTGDGLAKCVVGCRDKIAKEVCYGLPL